RHRVGHPDQHRTGAPGQQREPEQGRVDRAQRVGGGTRDRRIGDLHGRERLAILAGRLRDGLGHARAAIDTSAPVGQRLPSEIDLPLEQRPAHARPRTGARLPPQRMPEQEHRQQPGEQPCHARQYVPGQHGSDREACRQQAPRERGVRGAPAVEADLGPIGQASEFTRDVGRTGCLSPRGEQQGDPGRDHAHLRPRTPTGSTRGAVVDDPPPRQAPPSPAGGLGRDATGRLGTRIGSATQAQVD
ncbi:MAG: hypothetical protein ACK559_15210, partial [bacterium]